MNSFIVFRVGFQLLFLSWNNSSAVDPNAGALLECTADDNLNVRSLSNVHQSLLPQSLCLRHTLTSLLTKSTGNLGKAPPPKKPGKFGTIDPNLWTLTPTHPLNFIDLGLLPWIYRIFTAKKGQMCPRSKQWFIKVWDQPTPPTHIWVKCPKF